MAIAAFIMTPMGGAFASPAGGVRAAVHAAPASRPSVRSALRPFGGFDARRFGSSASGVEFGGNGFGASPFYTGFYGPGSAAASFRYGRFGEAFNARGFGGRSRFEGWGGAFYGADPSPGFADPGPEASPSSGLPVVLGIEDAPVARPQVTIINGGAGEARSSLRRPRRDDVPTVNGPGGPAYPSEQAAFAAPRIYRVTVPRG